MTAVTTLRQQNRDVLREAYLTKACAAAARGAPAPSLRPEASIIKNGA